jgi:hypothetical protein
VAKFIVLKFTRGERGKSQNALERVPVVIISKHVENTARRVTGRANVLSIFTERGNVKILSYREEMRIKRACSRMCPVPQNVTA